MMYCTQVRCLSLKNIINSNKKHYDTNQVWVMLLSTWPSNSEIYRKYRANIVSLYDKQGGGGGTYDVFWPASPQDTIL